MGSARSFLAGSAFVEHRLRGDRFVRVGPVDGLEHAVLQPARVHLGVERLAAGEAAEVRVRPRQSEEPHLQRQLDLRLEAGPRAAHVARPGDQPEALRTGESRAHHDERPRRRQRLAMGFVHQSRPLVTVGVVHLVAGCLQADIAEPMDAVARMHFGLAQVAPGARHALVEEAPIKAGEPGARVVVENIDQAGVAEEEIEAPRCIGDVARQRAVRHRTVPVVRRRENERLGDRDRADAVAGEVGNHVLGVRPRLPIPVEVAHVTLDVGPEPVQVEHDGVEGDALATERSHGRARFFFVSVAEARSEVAQRPARRQRLAAGGIDVVVDQFRIAGAGDHDVGGAAGHGFELQHVVLRRADVEETRGGIIEDDHVAIVRHDGGQAVIHLRRRPRVTVARLVVERQALAASIHAQHALAAAQDLLVRLERKAKTAHRLAREIAVFFLDQRSPVMEPRQRDRRALNRDAQLARVEKQSRVVDGQRRGDRRRSRVERERRQLAYAGLAVVSLDRSLVDRGEAQRSDARFDA